MTSSKRTAMPVGDGRDLHAWLAAERRQGPVRRLGTGGWLVLSHRLANDVMRGDQLFTVDDPRFSTAQVIGTSMLSTDGREHARHRRPFVEAFTPRITRQQFEGWADEHADRLVSEIAGLGSADLRAAIAAPMAAAGMQRALGLHELDQAQLLGWYAELVAGVAELTAGRPAPAASSRAYAELGAAVAGRGLLARIEQRNPDQLDAAELISNAAVLLFGGVDTTDGMISNLAYHLLAEPDWCEAAGADPQVLDRVIEESLRLEPAAATLDRYATADVELGEQPVRRGDLVMISLAAANRDPEVFADPDRFDPDRRDLARHLAFARGPHICLGLHLARLEARAAMRATLALPRLRAIPSRRSHPVGLVFRRPPDVWAAWAR